MELEIIRLIQHSDNTKSIHKLLDFILTNTVTNNNNNNIINYEYYKNLYKFNNINYKLYNLNKYLNCISN